jgi:hypothetical protein
MAGEANLAADYRKARREFIAAAGGDTISRVHPAKGPDGKPLFCDSAAFGPRDAARALLLIGGPLVALLKRGLAPPNGARLVVVHALDPHARAWGRPGSPEQWPQTTLASIATEDLARVKELTVLEMEGGLPQSALAKALAAALPKAKVRFHAVAETDSEAAVAAVIAAL